MTTIHHSKVWEALALLGIDDPEAVKTVLIGAKAIAVTRTVAMDAEYIDIDPTPRIITVPADVHPEDFCGRCGGPNIVWSAPSPLWNEVMRGGDINATDLELFGGIVCPICFATLAEEAGIADLWKFHAKREYRELSLVTPSGRVWNEQTWMWDEPKPVAAPTAAEVVA